MVLLPRLVKALFLFSLFLFDLSSVSAETKLSFGTKKIKVRNLSLNVMIADDDQKRTKGMMFIEAWPKNTGGMLFIFPTETTRSFWMKNTILPLSLGFFNSKGLLVEMADMNPAKSLAQVDVDRIQTKSKAKYVLEVPQGWFKKNQIKLGAKLRVL